MVADKIKHLREQMGITQSDLAKKLGITRSSVNAWELGISVPSLSMSWSRLVFLRFPRITLERKTTNIKSTPTVDG